MSQWATRILNHSIWDTLGKLGPAIDKAIGVDGITPEALDGLERLKVVLGFAGKKLGAVDPLLILPASVDALAASFNSQLASVEAFASSKDVNQIAAANAQADAALSVLGPIPALVAPEELISLSRAAEQERALLSEHYHVAWDARERTKADVANLAQTLESFKTEMQTAVGAIKSTLEAERTKISAQSTEQQKQFSDAQEGRSNTYNETIRKIQESLTKTLTDQQGQFSAAQENRSREFTAAQTESQKRFSDLINDYTKRLGDQDVEFTKKAEALAADSEKKLSELQATHVKQADEILSIVNKRLSEVEKLVGVIGNLGVTSGYQTTANQARLSMWIWQGAAVVAMGIVILFAFKAFLPAIQGEFHWSSFVGRVFLTVTVGVLAAYAAAQADRFFHIEKNNRKLALELAAIDPFIALLPVEEQYKFKLEIGRRSFAQEEGGPVPTSKSPATTLDVLLNSKEGQQFLQIVADALGKVPQVPTK